MAFDKPTGMENVERATWGEGVKSTFIALPSKSYGLENGWNHPRWRVLCLYEFHLECQSAAEEGANCENSYHIRKC